MKRIQAEKPKVRREREYDALPLDPRDPDIVRVKQLMYAQQSRTQIERGRRTCPLANRVQR